MPDSYQGHGNQPLVTLQQKVNFLSETQHYPQKLKYVRPVQTHMSWVFLTDMYVYKMKKPVKYPYLDYSTLSQRKGACHDEIKLNQQLAPDIYLDVVPLNYNDERKFHLEGDGMAVEWLVKTRRVDIDMMLDELMQKDAVPDDPLKEVAQHLGRFYQEQEPLEIDAFAYWNKLLKEIRGSYQVLLEDRFALPLDLVKDVISTQQSFLTGQENLFRDRIQHNFIKEGHGDLRPDHICLLSKPVILDRLEFNRDLRIVDTLDDLAYLDMECDRHRNPATGKVFLDTYAAMHDDPVPENLLMFYKSKRATLRAKLTLEHLNDKQYTDYDKWVNKAHDYLSLAKRYTNAMKK